MAAPLVAMSGWWRANGWPPRLWSCRMGHRYRAIFERNLDFLSSAAGNSHGPSLMNIMMELRKCCNHPFLIDGAEASILAIAGVPTHGSGATSSALGEQLVYAAGKMVLLHKFLPKLRSQGRKVLVFSQMTRVLNLLVRRIAPRAPRPAPRPVPPQKSTLHHHHHYTHAHTQHTLVPPSWPPLHAASCLRPRALPMR